jgi:hypothetical protein
MDVIKELRDVIKELNDAHVQVEGHAGALERVLRASVAGDGRIHADEMPKFSEDEDDRELFKDLFATLDTDSNGYISQEEIRCALHGFSGHEEMKVVLESLLESKSLSQPHDSHPLCEGLDFKKFSEILEKLPRVRGERVKWARTLRLEEVLARNLPKGDVFDGLKGLRALPDSERRALAESLASKVSAILPNLILEKLYALSQSNAAPSAEALSHLNSKFCLDGAYIGRFATLDDFYRGPEALIGTPNPKIEVGMETEHCRRDNNDEKFTTSNYNVETYSRLEWEFVVNPREGFDYPHTPSDKSKWRPDQIWSETKPNGWKGAHGRDPIRIEAFLIEEESALVKLLEALSQDTAKRILQARSEIKKAGLLRMEVIGLRLYTGPLFAAYNAVLRGFPVKDVEKLKGNRYETTIFVITSGITKMSKISALPANRLLYRGLGGMILPRQFWDTYDECIVDVHIFAGHSTESTKLLAVVRSFLRKAQDEPAKSPRTKVFDISLEHLQLPDAHVPESLREMVACGIRVVKDPQAVGASVSVTLALAVPKFRFEQELRKDFEEALRAACGRHVAVNGVAAKPYGFRGGGAPPPLPS